MNLVIRNLHLQLVNSDFERRYRIKTGPVSFRCLYHLPAQVIQLLVVMRDDAFGVI